MANIDTSAPGLAGMDGHLAKPVTTDRLHDALDRYLVAPADAGAA